MTSEDRYNDQIGWLIVSFFLIFLGSMLPTFFGWVNNLKNITPILASSTIIFTMLFGLFVFRLFFRTQKKRNVHKESLMIAVIFLLLIEFLLLLILYYLSPKIVFLTSWGIMGLILLMLFEVSRQKISPFMNRVGEAWTN